jgi:hypothetical protein
MMPAASQQAVCQQGNRSGGGADAVEHDQHVEKQARARSQHASHCSGDCGRRQWQPLGPRARVGRGPNGNPHG